MALPDEDPIGSLAGGLWRRWAFWGQNLKIIDRSIND
jgi:hypothetical protein